ncbi:MAG TPA: response regulator [Rhizomicrobium sp.]|nr:response regulator [Rhizomicrobium sp.]
MGANRAIFLGAIPILAVLGLAAFALFTFATGERAEQGWVLHTYQVMDSLRTVLNDAADAETGQRGYLLTRKQNYLQPYLSARFRLARDLGTFQYLTRDNPYQQARARQLRKLLDDRFKLLDEGLAVGSAGALAPANLVPLLDEGKAMMEATRVSIALGLAEEQRLLAERIRARRAVEGNEILTAVLLAVLALIVLFVAGAMLVRNNVKLALSEAIRARQARILQATLDNIRDGIVVFDEADKVAAFNEIFFRLMDFPTTLAAMGAALGEFRAVDEKLTRSVLDDVPATAQHRKQDYARLERGGLMLDVYKAGIGDDGFLIAAADVTDRIRAEAGIRQSQKMETVGHLTGGVAHDFNNLLQIISANLDLAVADARTDHKTAERLQAAIAAVERGSRLTAQLLAFARRQALESRTIHPGRLVQDMTDLLRRTLGERVEVECIVAGGLWNTLIDVNQLQNAILNLAINARDAMGEGGGKLTIEVANAYLDDDYAAQHAEVSAGQYVMIAVSDTGSGMAPDVIARAFDPFFTTKSEGKGTGLGLSQVYGFVKQSNGHVKIYSELDHGTAVKLYLPRSKKPEEADAPTLSPPVEGGSESILVVEDDDGVRAAVTDMLTELGYRVASASGGLQALDYLTKNPRIDLLFTDVVMPGPMGSRELARRAKDLVPGLLVLFTSGYTQNAIVHNGQLDADVVLLSKPYRKDDLARKLRLMLRPAAAPNVAALAKPTDTRVTNASPVTRRKILVVEDEALIRMTTVDMVEEIGLAYAEAGDAPSALKLLDADAEIDILLTDLGLPGMNGAELVAEARKRRPDLIVIIASGYSTEKATGDGALTGVYYLGKPFNLTQLRDAIAQAG